jgi:hypothetical protein
VFVRTSPSPSSFPPAGGHRGRGRRRFVTPCRPRLRARDLGHRTPRVRAVVGTSTRGRVIDQMPDLVVAGVNSQVNRRCPLLGRAASRARRRFQPFACARRHVTAASGAGVPGSARVGVRPSPPPPAGLLGTERKRSRRQGQRVVGSVSDGPFGGSGSAGSASGDSGRSRASNASARRTARNAGAKSRKTSPVRGVELVRPGRPAPLRKDRSLGVRVHGPKAGLRIGAARGNLRRWITTRAVNEAENLRTGGNRLLGVIGSGGGAWVSSGRRPREEAGGCSCAIAARAGRVERPALRLIRGPWSKGHNPGGARRRRQDTRRPGGSALPGGRAGPRARVPRKRITTRVGDRAAPTDRDPPGGAAHVGEPRAPREAFPLAAIFPAAILRALRRRRCWCPAGRRRP